MGGLVLGILVWQEGGQYVCLIMGLGAVTLAALAYWLVHRKRQGKATLLDPAPFKHLNFRIGISQQMLQQITLGGAMIVLPLFLHMTLEYNAMQAGLSLAPLSLSMFGMAMLAGRKAGRWRPARIVLAGFAASAIGMPAIIPLVPRVDSGWYLADQPKAVQGEILAINTHARDLSLQIALLIPALASVLGLANSFRMLRLPDITPRADTEGVGLG